MRRVLIAIVVLFVAVPASGATTGTGLRGLVMRGPVTPVCQQDVSCDAPAKHVTLTFTRGGVAKSVVTGDDGRYRVVLAAGTYAVRIPSARFGFSPHSAVVTDGRMSVRNFSIDTGMR
jgi:hypothetical protein